MAIKSKIMRPSPPSSSGDIISNLPSDALENILTCLPLRDAVRASILSRSWRDKWTSIPNLVFDKNMFRDTPRMITHNRLLIALYEVAHRYCGTALGFVLCLPGLESCPQIDQVISQFSKDRGFKDFALHMLEGDERYKLPSSFYSWVEMSHLSLQYCVIDPPIWFEGFSRLVSLEISNCSIHHDALLGLISSSPILEKLNVVSLVTIERRIEISAPNLRELFFTGVFPKICFEYAPRLYRCVLKLHVDSKDEGTCLDIFQSLRNLPAIKHLDLSYYYARDKLDCGSLPRKLTTTLNHLTYLRLRDISFFLLHEVSNVLRLIRSSPNLVKLVVLAYEGKEYRENCPEDVVRLFKAQEWSEEVNLNSLKEVELRNISGTPSELGFIELLLSTLPKLETLMITTNHIKVSIEDRFEITTQMMGFRRVSPLAKIIYRAHGK